MLHPAPELYQPPLRWYSHAWRFALCLALSALVWAPVVGNQWRAYRYLFVIDLVAGLACYVLVMYRRRWPLTIALVTSALTLVSGVAVGPSTLASVSLATRRRFGQIAIVGLVGLVSYQGYSDTQPFPRPDPIWLTILSNVIATIAILGWGMFIGSRRELLWTLQQRALAAETESELRVDHARTHERAAIAREMHDVLAHRISQVSMHAAALEFREDLSAPELRAGLSTIHANANAALTDLRAVLGVLRDQDGELTDRPQPTYDDLPALIDWAVASGMNVDFSDVLADPGPGGMPKDVGRTVYRIVQEGLTNARKHAPGAAISVRVSGAAEDGVDIWVENPVGFAGTPVAPGSRLGLIGLHERALLRGGRLEHNLEHGREGDRFILHGWIPWSA